jgi:stage II sporulation protein D
VLIGKVRKPQIIGTDITRSIAVYGLNKNFPGKNSFKFFCDKMDDDVSIELASSGPIYFADKPYDGKIIVYSNSGECLVVQSTALESYLAGVVAKEMNPNWPLEALKAQAVVARSYALHKISESKVSRYHLENSEKHQVGGHILEQTARTKEAVKQTAGQALVNKNGQIVPAFYHAKCGERSFLPQEIWGNEVEGYSSVPCPYDEENSKEVWTHKIKASNFISFLNRMCNESKIECNSSGIKKIDISSDSMLESRVRIHSDAGLFYLKKSLVRKNYGESKIISNSFRVNIKGSYLFIEGKGRGHGVGMGQIGALMMAKLGLNYRQILSYYYPNFKISEVYP